ncbi:protein kinase catalytic domain-containing protein [Penicillium canescens]|nr:protein kinase catalytic domain-containing protein [Penicillium canescens]
MMAAYNLLSDAKGMPAQFHYLRVRLKTEQHRLLNWAEVVNLTEQNESLCGTLRLNEVLVQEVLREQEAILAGFWKLGHPYRFLVDDGKAGFLSDAAGELAFQERFPHAKSSLETRALRCIEAMRRYPVRIRWAAFDRERFETSLAQLGALNDAMKSLLDSQQQLTLHQVQTRTSMQILQLNNKVNHLLQIFQAGNMQLSTAQLSEGLRCLQAGPSLADSEPEQERAALATLARFKALNIAINSDTGDEPSPSSSSTREAGPLDAEACTILRSSPASYATEIEHSDGLYEGNPVWIEWKYYDPVLQTGHPDSCTRIRISKLSALLNNPHVLTQFHTPACIGYFNDEPYNRFGLVFRRPTGPSSAHAPTSLFDLFLDEKPSLSARVQLAHTLATAIQHLHSTNWIHKALRSQNVVFFTDPGHPDLSTPFLCGFGLSRPAHNIEMTERPDSTPLYNLYRHPLAHGDVATEGIGGFKKAFDIYSLGIVLLETALWIPLHRVLGIESENVQKYFRPGVTKKIRGMLLRERRFLDMVRAAAGDTFGDVVKVCLEGFGEGESESGERFYEEVVVRLERVLV